MLTGSLVYIAYTQRLLSHLVEDFVSAKLFKVGYEDLIKVSAEDDSER